MSVKYHKGRKKTIKILNMKIPTDPFQCCHSVVTETY